MALGGVRPVPLSLDGLLLFHERVEVPAWWRLREGAWSFFKLPNQVCIPPVLTRLIQRVLAADELLLNVLNVKRSMA